MGSVSKASDHLHVAQAALSRQIKQLEHDLKAQLFVRNGRGMQLTDAGQLLLSRSRGVVRQLEQVRDDIVSLAGAPNGRVSLGIVPTVSCVLAGRLAARVVDSLPGVSLRLVESYGGHLVDWLHRGEIDLAIIYGQEGGLHLVQDDLALDRLMIIGPVGSCITSQSGGSLEWLSKQRLVLPSKHHGLRQLIERAAQRKGLRLDVRIEADSFRAMIDIVERGIAFSVLPPSAIVRERERGSLEVDLLSNPRVPRRLVLARSPDSSPSLAVEAIAALIKAETAAVARTGIWSVASQAAATAMPNCAS